ncbi:ATP-binding protein [Catellatospora sp. TT07R-123]|uniref:ATP-binding protein n=1 Tax=Catellatospora sp. TT07R-123 TaxID=2733863 RepID=UPI001BB35101|nr:DUF87 domain-containing protein [Catellatospora sp. TT07R-123]
MTQQLSGLAALAAAEASPLAKLLLDAKRIGGIYHLDYEKAVVITDDFAKRAAGGVPRHSFLLAAATRPTRETSEPLDEDEVILLRVRGVAQLPHQPELVATRMTTIRDANVRDQRPSDIVDPLTGREIETCAFECDVLGTFYPATVAGDSTFIKWGADIDNVYSGARYFVYSPSARVLSFIASYPERTEDEAAGSVLPSLVRIGTVRYAATRRRAEVAGMQDVPVRIRVTDFVSRKTAILGMTRAGKSNTVKTICTSVFEHSRRAGRPIGQLIFDPQGEYANVNKQDNTGLRLLGQDWVTIYRFGASNDHQQVKPLTLNFYDPGELAAARDLVNDCLAGMDAKYVHAFRAAEVSPPAAEDFPAGDKDSAYWEAKSDAERARLAFYATLAKAGFKVPPTWAGIRFSITGELADAILADHAGVLVKGSGNATVKTGEGLKKVMDWLCNRLAEHSRGKIPAQYLSLNLSSWLNCGPFNDVRAAYDATGGSGVLNSLKGFVEFHSAHSSGDVASQVYDDLTEGKVVIVDLSFGSERVATVMSERIVNRLLERGNQRFRQNLDPVAIQIVVEEAHRLFDRRNSTQDTRDPWVALAKEAAKYDIGLLYATQEVSAIDPRILSNTHNWIIAHLNSDRETRELSHYYDFAQFADSIKRAEERGFVRMKTLSGQYIVPVQIAKFDHDMINRARAAAGLDSIDPQTLAAHNGHLPRQPLAVGGS